MAMTANAQTIFQLEHRFKIITSWFGGNPENAQRALSNSSIVEIGCGQGDMTTALAKVITSVPDSQGKVFAVDPAPLDYGAPETLGQAQSRISQTALGKVIQWIRQDPLQYLHDPVTKTPDFVVLAHSIWYLPSESYFRTLLKTIRDVAGEETKLCLSEWSMRSSRLTSQAHLFAVEAQAMHPLKDGNVRTMIRPERIVEIAKEAGWKVYQEDYLEASNLDDGKWEVACTRMMQTESTSAEARQLIASMEEACEKHPKVSSMDVWSGCFSAAA